MNRSEDGQDDEDWMPLDDVLGTRGYDPGGAAGAPTPFGQLVQEWLDREFTEYLQEGYDQDPVQGVADENGTFSVRPRIR